VEGTARVADEGADKEGALSFGPYVLLRSGLYRFFVRYESFAPSGQEVGRFDVASRAGAKISASLALRGTGGGAIETATIGFGVSKQLKRETFEFRNYWNGSSDLRVLDIRLTQE
jgi:hypothetical protein